MVALCLGFGVAHAGSSSSGEEYLSLTEAVEPNILFLIDLSEDMEEGCPCVNGDSGDTGECDDDSDSSCLEDVLDAIDQITQHFDWARYGIIGTSDNDTYGDSFTPIIPLGTSYSDISDALDDIELHETSVRNLSEALAEASAEYFANSDSDDESDDDGDGFDNDWDEAPIEYYCQENHIIVITSERPKKGDDEVSSSYISELDTDVTCDSTGVETEDDTQCLYDNVVYTLYNKDHRSDLDDDQTVTVHTISFDADEDSVGAYLFGNASDQIDNAGIFTSAEDGDDLVAQILEVMSDIRSGTYSRSTPVVSADGSHLIYTFYELEGDTPMAEGHVRAYAIDTDPTSSTYGQVQYDDDSDFEGAVWDAGTLLVSRPVTGSESNPDDRDGFGKRDIYTFFEPAISLLSESETSRRQGFDYDFVKEVGNDSTALKYILDTTSTTSPPCADDLAFDLTKDDCTVDDDDLQALVDFARGLPEAEFRYLDEERGNWKLGDSPHSIPVVVQAREGKYAVDPTYLTFLAGLEDNEADGTSPDIVLIAANDGMLHAFALKDDTSTSGTEEGEELWAWIPGYLLYREHDQEWAGRLLDLMLYGRTFLFDGSPVVEDVWVDEDGDGAKSCNTVPDDCEWKRVVVVQQGKGGPVTLALDITETADPVFLWEQTDETDSSAMGYTVGRPVVANVYDSSDGDETGDRWVAIWGGGRGVPYASSHGETYYESAEANLYMWALGDDYWGTLDWPYQDDDENGWARGDNGHPEEDDYGSELDTDSDDHSEYAYISAALAVVDVDSDGDADTVYFPVSTAYKPKDEDGKGPGDISDPGSTWLYKACINDDDPGDLTWVEFYDPVDDGDLEIRPEVYYSATTSWHSDGSLGVYWGTGTPYDRTNSDKGYFFLMKDSAPEDCESFKVSPITDCGANGIYALDEGEGLTSEAVVYASVVYFSTWVPDEDRCDGGTGRLYGLDFEDCDPGMDTDGDGAVDSSDDEYIEEEDSYISGVTITDMGTLFYGTSAVDEDGDSIVGTVELANDPFLGTQALGWMEVF